MAQRVLYGHGHLNDNGLLDGAGRPPMPARA